MAHCIFFLLLLPLLHLSRSETPTYNLYMKERVFKLEQTLSRTLESYSMENEMTEFESTSSDDSEVNNDKEELRQLNMRLAEYITNVRALEQRNKDLETENEQLRMKPVNVEEMYKKRIEELSAALSEMEAEVSALDINYKKLTDQYEKEQKSHAATQETLDNFRKSEAEVTKKIVKMATDETKFKSWIQFQDKVIEELSRQQKPSEYVRRMDEMRKAHEAEINNLMEQLTQTQAQLNNLHSVFQRKTLRREMLHKEELKAQEERITELIRKEIIVKSENRTTTTSEAPAHPNVELGEEISRYSTLINQGESLLKAQQWKTEEANLESESGPGQEPEDEGGEEEKKTVLPGEEKPEDGGKASNDSYKEKGNANNNIPPSEIPQCDGSDGENSACTNPSPQSWW